MPSLITRIKTQASKLGFDSVGIAPAEPGIHLNHFFEWIKAGYHGQQGYLARHDRIERRRSLDVILPGASSLIVVGRHYWPGPPLKFVNDPSCGQISCYATGTDYHDEIKRKLDALFNYISHQVPQQIQGRAYVDTGPLLERDHALCAGLGFIGKNCHLIQPKRGSWLFLGILILDLELEPDEPGFMPDCGTCSRCQRACPTGAFVRPYVLDSRRCISYLTTAIKESIPRELRSLVGNRIFGCDVCQQVCPWNRFATPVDSRKREEENLSRDPRLIDLIGLTENEFMERYGSTPIGHIGRNRFLRNVAVALGNWGSPDAIPVLESALLDASHLVREHAAWALGQIDSGTTRKILYQALDREQEASVVQEIRQIIG